MMTYTPTIHFSIGFLAALGTCFFLSDEFPSPRLLVYSVLASVGGPLCLFGFVVSGLVWLDEWRDDSWFVRKLRLGGEKPQRKPLTR